MLDNSKSKIMILICYGTRPEWIKIKPLIKEFKNEGILYKILFTGQHPDIAPKDGDFNLTMNSDGTNRLDTIVQNCMNIPDEWFGGITHVLVQGDTTSVLSLALAAFHRKIKIIHLEAGLRTYDFENPYPEEMNRQLVSRIADIHLCPTELNKQNLQSEKVRGDILVVGNTVLDDINTTERKYGKDILVTLHRRENHDMIDQWFKEINELAKDYPNLNFILPIHPNPNIKKHKDVLTHVNVIDPLDRDDLLKIIKGCRFIISDSGGIQEEASYLNKKIIVCRKITERPESIYTGHSRMCSTPKQLRPLFHIINNDYQISNPCPYGDGKSSARIAKELKKIL